MARAASLRIVGGTHAGRRIAAPPGRETRPTSDRVREALFSILGPLDGARVLDLFAGSGALGLEALSRGAAEVLFVERNPRAAGVVRANLDALSFRADVYCGDAVRWVGKALARGAQYDLLFLDPPYGTAVTGDVVALVAEGGRIVTESDRRKPLELPLELTDERRYGDTLIRIHQP